MINKIAKNVVAIISIIILAILTLMSLMYVSVVKNFFENVFINLTTSVGLFVYIAIDFIILSILKKVKDIKISKKVKLVCIIGAIIIYFLCSMYWVKNATVVPIDDSKSVNDLAVCFAKRRI